MSHRFNGLKFRFEADVVADVVSFTCSLLISLSASMCSFLNLSISSRSSASDRDG